ncbi:MAG: hypothetical protein ACOC08_01805 [Campylobacterales bacterium]
MLCSIDDNVIEKVWHRDFFMACRGRLSESEYGAMIDRLNEIIDEKSNNKEDIVVSSFIPGKDWSDTVWDPIYSKACGKDVEHSAMFFGLLVCQVLIDRDEKWYFIDSEIASGMTYFLSKEDANRIDNVEAPEVKPATKNQINDLLKKLE